MKRYLVRDPQRTGAIEHQNLANQVKQLTALDYFFLEKATTEWNSALQLAINKMWG